MSENCLLTELPALRTLFAEVHDFSRALHSSVAHSISTSARSHQLRCGLGLDLAAAVKKTEALAAQFQARHAETAPENAVASPEDVRDFTDAVSAMEGVLAPCSKFVGIAWVGTLYRNSIERTGKTPGAVAIPRAERQALYKNTLNAGVFARLVN